MLANGVLFLLGLGGLYFGAEWLVAGAARLARRFGTSPLVVGLTVVAFGSSAPELLVGVVASLGDQGDVVLGNVIGSNILNVAVILGVAALIRPLRVGMRILSREVPLMVAFSLLLMAMMLDGAVDRADGFLLLLGFVAFIWFVLQASRGESPEVAAEYMDFETTRRGRPLGTPWAEGGLVLLGTIGLVIGAQLLVSSAVYFAHLLGVSEVVIGITVVAIGTSLPELATCVVAAARSESDIALGNAVGSNIFNLLSILGVSALIRPIQVDHTLLEFEVPAMVVFALMLVPLAWRGRVLGRGAGLVLLTGYLLFTAGLVGRVMT